MAKKQPTAEQLEALRLFRSRSGRRWKSLLNDAWQTGNYGENDDICGLLQQVRNTFGPTWLVNLRLKELEPEPYQRAAQACGTFEPAQEPEVATTVCVHCGWERAAHRAVSVAVPVLTPATWLTRFGK